MTPTADTPTETVSQDSLLNFTKAIGDRRRPTFAWRRLERGAVGWAGAPGCRIPLGAPAFPSCQRQPQEAKENPPPCAGTCPSPSLDKTLAVLGCLPAPARSTTCPTRCYLLERGLCLSWVLLASHLDSHKHPHLAGCPRHRPAAPDATLLLTLFCLLPVPSVQGHGTKRGVGALLTSQGCSCLGGSFPCPAQGSAWLSSRPAPGPCHIPLSPSTRLSISAPFSDRRGFATLPVPWYPAQRLGHATGSKEGFADRTC